LLVVGAEAQDVNAGLVLFRRHDADTDTVKRLWADRKTLLVTINGKRNMAGNAPPKGKQRNNQLVQATRTCMFQTACRQERKTNMPSCMLKG
jgi:hypothetical protein